ncbi:MAG: type I-D CRISPR-associated protein Cas10d/Csc3 [Caldilineaceae bacterium]|nr:type I-D CRISPR-associated protein Cas10d/Csc3 [Caldilineaceae bacterium]HRJ40656.1 type I-D CRISPR-associated protein Cas10d/Csc3 [Caldilineaceae bacterium]
MSITLDELMLKLAGKPGDVLGDYIDYIANRGLGRYRRIVQWGGKEGQPLYAHILDLVFTLERLSSLLELSITERRVLMLVLSVHDLNKVPEFQHLGSYNKLANPEAVAEELERIGAEEFFPDWRDYLRDIVTLMRAHSDHSHVAGELLVLGGNYRLGQERIEELVLLVRALDVIDLSHSLHERKHKRRFLDHLNEFSATQYELVHHVVAEQRGILTNVIHNRIAEYMQQEKGAWPLLYYPDGVVYLVRRGASIGVSEDDYKTIGKSIANWLEDQTRGRFSSFIKATNQGIKIDSKCLELGISFSRIWQTVDTIIQGKRYAALENMENRARERAEQSIAGDSSLLAESVRQRLTESDLIPRSIQLLHLGELVRSYYIFLSKHFKREISDPWAHLYAMLEVSPERQAFYSHFDINYDRAYVLAGELPQSYEFVFRKIETDGKQLLGDMEVESPWQDVFQQYVQSNAQFSFQLPETATFTAYLQRYVQQNHKQSAYGSSEFETELWRSDDVPKTIKVQQFSNRLAAGPGDPVKRIDPITKAQFLLEKLNYPPAFKASTYYLHIYPYAFFSPAYIESWRRTVRELAEQDVSALFIKTDDSLRSIFDSEQPIQLPVSASNSNGLPLPGAPELLGNLLIWPLNAPGRNDTEQFWYAFTCAYAMHRYVGGRVVLTRSATPIVGPDEFADLLIDEIPLTLQGLLRENGYTYKELTGTQRGDSQTTLEGELKALYAVYRQVYNPSSKVSEVIALASSLNDGALGIFYAAERLLLQRIRDDKKVKSAEWALIRAAGHMNEALNYLAYSNGGKQVIKTIEKLAQLAWEGNLKGKSLEKNSLMTPLDECFVKIQQKEAPIDDGALRAATSQDIYEYLGRIREAKMIGRTTQIKVNAFVDAFFDELLGKVYQNNRQRLLNDEKLIRSAFLFHVRELLALRSAEKSAESEPTE